MKEMEPIDPKKIIIARKWSYIEWNMYHHNLNMEEFIDYQKSLGIKTETMVESHYEQLASLGKILGQFEQKPKVLVGETLTKEKLRFASVVFSLGGDDHLKYVSHFMGEQPILALNSDYDRSEGGMIYCVPSDLETILPNLKTGNYKIENWPRLEATILKPNRKPLKIKQLAISEIYVGTWARISMAKYNFNSPKRHKDSGVLIALPAGTGEASWFNSAGGNFPEPQIFSSRSEKIAWCLATEVWKGRTLPSTNRIRKICSGEKLEIYYTSYYDGTVSIDPKEGSGRNYLLKMGDRVIIEFSEKTLRVISKALK